MRVETLVDSGDHPPWRSKKTKAIRERNRTRQIKLPKQFSDAPDLLAWLESNGINDEAVFCSECSDFSLVETHMTGAITSGGVTRKADTRRLRNDVRALLLRNAGDSPWRS